MKLYKMKELLNKEFNFSKKWKNQCAVRQLCKWRSEWGLEKFRKYISTHILDQQLINDFVDQYSKGNRGEPNSWK